MMMSRMRFLVLLLLLSMSMSMSMSMSSLFHGTDSKESPRFVGGYEPIKNLADPHIQDIAKFAVSEYNNKSNSNLIDYQRIMYGEQQLVAGMNYVLIIEAKVDGTRLSRYEAYVSESLKQNLQQLTSFTPFVKNKLMAAQRFVGGYEPIENLTDPQIQDIAKFVVSEHNLIYQRIMYGEQQLVNGMNYVLIIEAKDGASGLSRYEAYLFESLDRTQLKLNSLMPFVQNPPPVLSAWKPVENLEKDMHILEIARYAVLEHNKKLLAKAKYHNHDDHVLVFEKVVSGETQLEAVDHDGVKYRLVISANGAKYEALVWEKVTSFKPLPP